MLQPLERSSFNPQLMPSTGELEQYDFTDKTTLAPAIWNVNLTFIVLVSLVVSLRVFTRAYLTEHFFVDDVLTVIAAVCILVSASTALVATKYGLGLHVWNLPQPMFENIMNCIQVSTHRNTLASTHTGTDPGRTAHVCRTHLLRSGERLHQALYHYFVPAHLPGHEPPSPLVRDGCPGRRHRHQRLLCDHLPVLAGPGGMGLYPRKSPVFPVSGFPLCQRRRQYRDRFHAGRGPAALLLVT